MAAATPTTGTYWLKQISASNVLVEVTTDASDPLDIAGPYKTLASAEAAAAQVNAQGGAGASLGSEIGVLPGALNAGSQVGPSLPTGLAAIGDFFARLTEASTWERVGLGVAGVLLLGIGLASITGSSKAAESVAKKLPTGALL